MPKWKCTSTSRMWRWQRSLTVVHVHRRQALIMFSQVLGGPSGESQETKESYCLYHLLGSTPHTGCLEHRSRHQKCTGHSSASVLHAVHVLLVSDIRFRREGT